MDDNKYYNDWRQDCINVLESKIAQIEKENELLRFTLEDIARGYDYSDGCSYTREEMIKAAEKTLKEANKQQKTHPYLESSTSE